MTRAKRTELTQYLYDMVRIAASHDPRVSYSGGIWEGQDDDGNIEKITWTATIDGCIAAITIKVGEPFVLRSQSCPNRCDCNPFCQAEEKS